ncbi:MAG: hypothetical protein IJ137_07240 [Eubacterium sp.]|nr:hypothetical protein [Eubacterium sp.]
MLVYILKRILHLIPVLLGVTFLTFLLLSVAPSDPVTMKYLSMGVSGDQEVMEAEREELGLNDPILVRYGKWMAHAVRGDFGESVKYGHSVQEEMGKRLPKTITLAACSLALAVNKAGFRLEPGEILSFSPRMTIGEYLYEPLRNYEKMSRKDAEKVIEEHLSGVGLSGEYMSRLPHELSGGQLQRVAIARASIY